MRNLILEKATLEELKAQKKELITLIREIERPKSPTERTINRSGLNRSVRSELSNFGTVQKTVRKKLNLPNRISLKHIEANKNRIFGTLLALCSKNKVDKLKDIKDTERLSILLTNRNILALFLTKTQKMQYHTGKTRSGNPKVWNATQIVDTLVRALTMNRKQFDLIVSNYKEQKRRAKIKARQ